MKHVIGLIFMALIALALFLFPTLGGWAVGVIGAGLTVVTTGALFADSHIIVKSLISDARSKAGMTMTRVMFERIPRIAITLALLIGVAMLPGFLWAKATLVALLFVTSLLLARQEFYRNRLLAGAYSVKF